MQIDLAVRIRWWRELGLPLEEIRFMIGSPERAKDVLTQHQYRLNAEIEERQLTLLDLRPFLQEDPMNYWIDQLPAR